MILPPKMTHLSQMDPSHYLISPPKIFVISIWIRQFFTYSYVFVAKRHSFGLPSISSSFILAFASFTLLSFTYWQICSTQDAASMQYYFPLYKKEISCYNPASWNKQQLLLVKYFHQNIPAKTLLFWTVLLQKHQNLRNQKCI